MPKANFRAADGSVATVVDWSISGEYRRTGVTLHRGRPDAPGIPVAMQRHPIDGTAATERFNALCADMERRGFVRMDGGTSGTGRRNSRPLSTLDALSVTANDGDTDATTDATTDADADATTDAPNADAPSATTDVPTRRRR